MNTIWSEQVDSILGNGFFLEHAGVKNWALGRDDALHAICELEALGIAILGGDVYQLVGEVIEQTYDSWYCDQTPEEPDSIFLRRSSDRAKSYIVNFLMDGALFAMVPKV